MENTVLLTNTQFTEVSLCPVLLCSLVGFPAVSPCHLHPTGAPSVLESQCITGSHCGSCVWVTAVLGPGFIPGMHHCGSLSVSTETCNPQRAGTQIMEHTGISCGLEGRKETVRCWYVPLSWFSPRPCQSYRRMWEASDWRETWV